MIGQRWPKCDPAAARALIALADGRGELLSHNEKAWSSATFTGSRHEIVLQFLGEDVGYGEALRQQLPGATFEVAGALVVEAAILWSEHRTAPALQLSFAVQLLLLDIAKEAT